MQSKQSLVNISIVLLLKQQYELTYTISVQSHMSKAVEFYRFINHGNGQYVRKAQFLAVLMVQIRKKFMVELFFQRIIIFLPPNKGQKWAFLDENEFLLIFFYYLDGKFCFVWVSPAMWETQKSFLVHFVQYFDAKSKDLNQYSQNQKVTTFNQFAN